MERRVSAMPVCVEIPPRYVRYAFNHAGERNESFEEREGYDNQANRWGVPPKDGNFVRIMGELAFSIYADLAIDSSLYEVSDGGADFQVRMNGDERTIDMKARRKEPFAFWIKEYRLRADMYILGHLESPNSPDSLEDWMVRL